MRLAISNIAWDTSEDEEVANLLRRHSVDAIDIAPGKYFSDPANASDPQIAAIRRWWKDHGVEITGMQALLFGTTGLNLFGTPAVQDAMLRHLDIICRIASGLGARRLVFGSPKNRDRAGLTDEQAHDTALQFFWRLGDIATSHGVAICIEPNPERYGCNFLTHSMEAARMVAEIDHPSIRMHLDTGTITVNGENVEALIKTHASLIGHVHASEPDLLPLGDGVTDHGAIAAMLREALPHHVVSIEMLATQTESHLAAIARALQVAIRHYRPDTVSEGMPA